MSGIGIDITQALDLRTGLKVAPGTSGTDNYEKLKNKPSIEGVTLQGDKTFPELGVRPLSVQEIEKILYLGG